jgi:hypothetical protein
LGHGGWLVCGRCCGGGDQLDSLACNGCHNSWVNCELNV